MPIFKIVAIAIISCVLILLIKQLKPEFTVVVLVATSVILLVYILKYFTQIFVIFNEIIDKTGINQDLFVILLKIVGVGYLVEFGASICEDTGNSSLAGKVILAGKIAIFIMAIPIIVSLFELITGLL